VVSVKCHCAEIEELHAEVESYQGALARVESLLYEWRNGPPVLMSGLTAAGKLTQAIYPARSEWTPEQIEKLREVLSDGPASAALADAPAEQRSERHHHSRKAMECVHNGSDCCVECCEPGGVTEQRAEGGADVCSRPGRVDGPWHSWKFDGDDPHIICHFCDEMRDSLTGRVIRPAAEGDGRG
jgi:hypothetical protein